MAIGDHEDSVGRLRGGKDREKCETRPVAAITGTDTTGNQK